jgi:hypothetical protein
LRVRRQFAAALGFATAWTVALPWIGELAAVLGWRSFGVHECLPGGAPHARRQAATAALEPVSYPALTVLVAAYNEVSPIGRTLRSIAEHGCGRPSLAGR